MTPDEKKLYALMAVAEQQQNLVNQAVKELQITKEHIQSTIAGQTHHTVSKAVNSQMMPSIRMAKMPKMMVMIFHEN